MGLSFRKSVTILPGVKVNLSKSGVSVSTGVKGLHASINTKGQIRGTASLPGTGIRYTKTTKVSKLLGKEEEKKSSKKTAKAKESKETKAAKAAPVEQPAQISQPAQPAAASAAGTQSAQVSSSDVLYRIDPETGELIAVIQPKAEAAPAAEAVQSEAAEISEAAEYAAEEAAAEELPAEPISDEKSVKLKKGDLAKAIVNMYAVADQVIDWGAIKNGTADSNLYDNYSYLKNRASKVLDGDIDTYLEIINDVNPFDEFIDLGSEFVCSTENPMKVHVDFTVNADKVFENYQDRELTEDYICGIAIKAARDLFALLPIWSVSLSAKDEGKELLRASFTRDTFEELNFSRIDASDTVLKFGGKISV
ncbi:MAG: DUF4236 domain-containing protein [Firmicutes bacterium]|nr:DUF4236 domain-containing protein [Bacillota bacterium]